MDQSQLFRAAEKGDLETLEGLLAGASVNLKNDKGATLLLVAAENGCSNIVEFLIGKGANPNLADNYDDVPLNRAAAHGHSEIVRFLAEHGAVVHSPDIGVTPLLTAAANGHLPVVRYLVEEKKIPVDDLSRHMGSPLQASACNGHLEVVRYLVSKGANANARDSYGKTAIDMAQECMSLSGLSDDEIRNLRAIVSLLKGEKAI
jgi:ankyrin repeat protein